jgi:hypothetical protein
MYYDPAKGTFKRGAGGESARRLRTVLGQFDRTFDLHSITEHDLLTLLPREFNRFNPRHNGAK